MNAVVSNEENSMDFNKKKMILASVITVPFLVAIVLFCYLWIYMPYVYEQDVERVKSYTLDNEQTVQERIASIEGVEKVEWISGEFFPCAVVKIKNKGEVNLCFVIADGFLYAKNDETVAVFSELEKTFKTMH